MTTHPILGDTTICILNTERIFNDGRFTVVEIFQMFERGVLVDNLDYYIIRDKATVMNELLSKKK